RYCITAANNNQAEAIDFTVTSTIQLVSALPSLATEVSITGPGADLLKVSGFGSVGPSFRVFAVLASGTVSISGLTIANGFAHNDGGGGILNWGRLTVVECAIANNTADASSSSTAGGGIY